MLQNYLLFVWHSILTACDVVLFTKFGNCIRNEWHEHLTSLTFSFKGKSNQLCL